MLRQISLLLLLSNPSIVLGNIDCVPDFSVQGSFDLTSKAYKPLRDGATYFITGSAELVEKDTNVCVYAVSDGRLVDRDIPEYRYKLSESFRIRLLQECEQGRLVLAYENLEPLITSEKHLSFEIVAMDYDLASWNDYFNIGVVVTAAKTRIGELNYIYADIKQPRCTDGY